MESVNEYGEKITEKELAEFAERVRKLPPEKIDELWFLCEFVFMEHEKNLKALRNEDIKKIKESQESAEDVVDYLLAETPIGMFKNNLEKVEKMLKEAKKK